MNKHHLPIVLASLMALAACSREPDPVIMQQQQPQIIAAPAPAVPVVIQQGGTDTGDMLAAGAIGYMMAGGGSNRGYQQAPAPRVVHRTTIVNRTVIQKPRPSYASAYRSKSIKSYSTSRSSSRSSRR